RFGRFPWDRRVLASLVDKLDAVGVKAIGLDMSLSDEDLGGQFAGAKRYRRRFEDISLAAPQNRAAIERFDETESEIAGAASALQLLNRKVKLGVVLLTEPELRDLHPQDGEEQARRLSAMQIHQPEWRERPDSQISTPLKLTWAKEYAGLRSPLTQILKSTKWIGSFNSLPDFDGVIRRTALTMRVGDRYYPSLDTSLAAIALGLEPQDVIPVTQTPEEGALL